MSDYRVNKNGFNVSTTADQDSKEWTISKIYENELTIDNLVKTLEVLDSFKRKYPNDETITNFEDIVREEICTMFGGTTLNEE